MTTAPTQLMVWIDQDLCTGDGICEEIAPDVFVGREGAAPDEVRSAEAQGG